MATPPIVPWTEDGTGGAVEEASDLLLRGEVVAHPTETVYGLAGAASDPRGYAGLLRVKGGTGARAFLLLFDTRERLAGTLGELPPGGETLARSFWPGPLTLLFPAAGGLPLWWSGPDGDVAARVTSHPFCHAVVGRLGGPVLSTSANRTGGSSLESAEAIAGAFDSAEVGLVVDGGRIAGLPSTLLRWTGEGWAVLREGPIPGASLARSLAGGGDAFRST